MKKILLIMSFLLAFTMPAQEDTKLDWETDFKKAKKMAKKHNKPILIYFTGSDWCSPCKMLKEDFFHSKKFQTAAEDLILVKADFPRRQDIITPEQKKANIALGKKYNKKNSYPTIVAVNYNGKVLGEIKSYNLMRDASRYFAFVNKILKNY